MRNSFKNYLGLFLVVVLMGCGSGGASAKGKKFIKDYKEILCIGLSRTASEKEKSIALMKLLEFNKQMDAITEAMTPDEQVEFAFELSAANIDAEAGKCN